MDAIEKAITTKDGLKEIQEFIEIQQNDRYDTC
jgi:hypothetical protein